MGSYVFKLVLLILCFLGALSLCPKGTYENEGNCEPCHEYCRICISSSICLQCKAQRAFYQHQCLFSCPYGTLPVFDDNLRHTNCVEPHKRIELSRPAQLFPFSEIRDYSQRDPDRYLVSPSGSFDIMAFGWIRTPQKSLETNENIFQIYQSGILVNEVFLESRTGEIAITHSESFHIQLLRLFSGGWSYFTLSFQVFEILTRDCLNLPKNGSETDACKAFYLLVGGSPYSRSRSLMRGLVLCQGCDQLFPKENVFYGPIETIHLAPFLKSDNPVENYGFLVTQKNTYHSISFVMQDMMRIGLTAGLLRTQVVDFLFDGCTIFELIDESGHLLLKYNIVDSRNAMICTLLDCFPGPSYEGIDLDANVSLLFDNSTRHLYINKGIWDWEEIPFLGGNATLILGGRENNSCTFFPLDILIYKGGSGRITETGENCKIIDIFKQECVICPKACVFKFDQVGCFAGDQNFQSFYSGRSNMSQFLEIPFCSKYNGTICLECEPGYVLNQNICKKICPEGQYDLPISSHEIGCRTCSIPFCKKCVYEHSSSKCKMCEQGYKVLKGQCVESCESLYELDNNCLESCPISTSPKERMCERCPSGCRKCINSTFCLSCEDEFNLFDNSCYSQECWAQNTASAHCPPCGVGCLNCLQTKESNICLQCIVGFDLLNGTCLTCAIVLKFLNQTEICSDQFVMPAGFYYTNQLKHAEECGGNCRLCRILAFSKRKHCDICQVGLSSSYGICKESCPKFHAARARDTVCVIRRTQSILDDKYVETQYKDNIYEVCRLKDIFVMRHQLDSIRFPKISRIQNISPSLIRKDNTCQDYRWHCKTYEDNQCKECDHGFFLNADAQCVQTCSKGFFKNKALRSCTKCPDGCLACLDQDICTECSRQLINNFTCTVPPSDTTADKPNSIGVFFKFWPETESAWEQLVKTSMVGLEGYSNFRVMNSPKYEFDMFMFTNLIVSQENKLQLHKKLGKCDPTCEICTYGALHEKPTCLECHPHLSDLELLDDRCACPNNKPFFDHLTLKCVPQCPPNRYLIPETKECLLACNFLSLFISERFIFAFNHTCVKTCPIGYRAEVNIANPNEFTCVKLRTFDLYSSLLGLLSDNLGLIPKDCLGFHEKSHCSISPKYSIADKFQLPLEQYISMLSNGDEALYDIIFEDQALFFINIYSQTIKIQDNKEVDSFLNFLKVISYGCTNPRDPFHILSSLDFILDGFTTKKLENITLLAEVFEGLNQCLEKLEEKDIQERPHTYLGRHLRCMIYESEGVNSHHNNKLVFSEIELEMQTDFNWDALFLSFLYCNITKELQNDLHYTIHLIGIFTAKDEKEWWESNITMMLNEDPKQTDFLILGDQNKWTKPESNQYSRDFIHQSHNKTLVGIVFPKAELEEYINIDIDDNRRGQELIGILKLTALGSILLCIIFLTLSRFKKEIDHKKTKKEKDFEEPESVIELKQNIEEENKGW